MTQDLPTGNVALLIDADNVPASAIDPVLTALADLGSVNIRRIYGNWSKPALRPWADVALRFALEPQQQFDLTKGKNATDMKMTIDAMDLLASGRVTGFGIMSSDSDFMPLVTRIRQDGLTVYGFGKSSAAEGFRSACNRFIDIETLMDTVPAGAEQPTIDSAAAKAVVDAEVVRLLTDAWEASRRDGRGFARLSEVGQRAANRSSFDTRNYGFARLSDLLEKVPGFVVERRDDGAFVKRTRPGQQ